MRILSWRRAAAVAGTIPILLAVSAAAQTPPAEAPVVPETYATLLTPLFTGNTTILGQEIAYPTDGVPRLTNAIVTVPPGGETGWHSHSVPLFAYVLEGALTIDYGSKGLRTVTAGMSFFEALDWAHNATNHGDTPARLLHHLYRRRRHAERGDRGRRGVGRAAGQGRYGRVKPAVSELPRSYCAGPR